ncbi:MAG: hypothetical protein AABW67_04175 [Nanoarchaeota archaeon]
MEKKLISLKPRIFKFEKGQTWDGDEEIIQYIEDVLLYDFVTEVKQKTYITIMVAKVKEK